MVRSEGENAILPLEAAIPQKAGCFRAEAIEGFDEHKEMTAGRLVPRSAHWQGSPHLRRQIGAERVEQIEQCAVGLHQG